jgi:hypothetical protein
MMDAILGIMVSLALFGVILLIGKVWEIFKD